MKPGPKTALAFSAALAFSPAAAQAAETTPPPNHAGYGGAVTMMPVPEPLEPLQQCSSDARALLVNQCNTDCTPHDKTLFPGMSQEEIQQVIRDCAQRVLDSRPLPKEVITQVCETNLKKDRPRRNPGENQLPGICGNHIKHCRTQCRKALEYPSNAGREAIRPQVEEMCRNGNWFPDTNSQ